MKFNVGPLLRGEAWAGDSNSATAVAATDAGRVDFVARDKSYYQDKEGKPAWGNFRRALIAKYGPPSREEEGGWGAIYHRLYWYYDAQWHTAGVESVPKECWEIDTHMPSSFPYNGVKWLPYTVHESCPVRLYAEVATHETLVDSCLTVMFDEPAAYRDSVAEAYQKKLEKERCCGMPSR